MGAHSVQRQGVKSKPRPVLLPRRRNLATADTCTRMAEVPEVRVAGIDELTARQIHGILKLRADVFILEQDCAYDDIDGRDAEPATRHLWIEAAAGAVAATLRVLDDGDGLHMIGRVCTHPEHRNRGLAAVLMRHAIELVGPPIRLNAQAHLADWYRTFGFEVCGDGWVEAGIPHLPMRLG
jgi:ElaA protein